MTEESGLDIMYALVLEDGKRWGEVATDWQIADVEAVFAEAGPNKHFLTRPRGGSKTTDIAGVAVSWLAADAPPRSRSYVVASNTDQAAILIDAAAGLIARTPELEGVLVVENERIINPETGAWVRVLSQSDSGAWGLRGTYLLILDEFAQWPETRGAKRVYTAVRSTVQKVKGCRLIILTSAGEPSHWSYTEVFKKALADLLSWRVSEMPGPVPWQLPEELESLRRELRPSEYDRLVLNIWSEDEDRAISPDDYEAAAMPCEKTTKGREAILSLNGPEKGHTYSIFVDIGTRNDATVIVVAHTEAVVDDGTNAARRLIIDHLERWQGSKKQPVQLAQVEERIVELSGRFFGAKVHGDPNQFVGTLQNLNRRGVKAEEFVFTATSVGQIATALVQTFRNRLIWIPDAPVLKDELLRVKLRESAPGVTRLDHDRSGHDDQAVTIGMAAHVLVGTSRWGPGSAFMQFMRNQVAKREPTTREEREHKREMNQFTRRHLGSRERAQSAAHRAQALCQHRWRGDRCVFCPAIREEVAIS